MKSLFLVFVYSLSFTAMGQSVHEVLNYAKSIRFENKDSSLLLVNQVLSNEDELPAELGYDAFHLKCQIYTDILQLDSAYLAIEKGLEWILEYDQLENRSNAYLNKAYIKRLAGELDSSMIFIQRSMEDCTHCMASIDELGHIYYDQGQIDLAILQHKKSYQLALDNDSYLRRVISLKHLVDLYKEKQDLENFNYFLEKLLEVANLNFEGPGVLSLHGELASFYFTPENISFYESSVKELKNKKSIRSHYLMASRLIAYYQSNGQLSKAERLLNETIEKLELNNDFKQRKVFYYLLYENLKMQGKYRDALEAFETYEIENAKYTKLEVQERIQELEVKYESARKEAEIKAQAAELEKRTYQRNILFGSLGLVSLLGISIYWGLSSRIRRNKRIAKQEQRIKDQQIQTLEQEKKLLSLASVLEGQEQERVRIAKELHDGLGGLLTAVKMNFSKIQSEILKVKNINIYESASNMIDKAHDEVRRISHNLMPSDLRVGGLIYAMDLLIQDLKNQKSINVEFEKIGASDLNLGEEDNLT